MSRMRNRTRIFVTRSFQIKYVGLILLLMFLAVVGTGYAVYATTWMTFGKRLAEVYPQTLLMDVVGHVNKVLLLRMIILAPVLAIAGLLASHKIAGPIYSIQRFIRKVYSGNYDIQLKLRKKDELHDLAESLNFLVSKLHLGREERNMKLEEMRKDILSIEEGLSSKIGDSDNIHRMLADLTDKVEKMKLL